MITNRLSKLVEIGSDPLIQSKPEHFENDSELKNELLALLSQKNGFYAFESALHLFPTHGTTRMSLENWNSDKLWKSHYGNLAEGLFFFAEDVFGGQFALGEGGIYSFDPETGKREKMSPDLEGWADCILVDYNFLIGYPLAHEWQKMNGELRPENRLVPKTPFVCGGKYTLENLATVNAVDGMKWRADLARQIRDLPDGSQIQIKILNSEPV